MVQLLLIIYMMLERTHKNLLFIFKEEDGVAVQIYLPRFRAAIKEVKLILEVHLSILQVLNCLRDYWEIIKRIVLQTIRKFISNIVMGPVIKEENKQRFPTKE